MARFYADENYPIQVVHALRRLGHDVLTALEAGQANKGIPDDVVLAFAHADHRAVLTLNRRDFAKLHRRSPDHSGIIACTENPNRLEMASQIHEEIPAELAGQFVKIRRKAR